MTSFQLLLSKCPIVPYLSTNYPKEAKRGNKKKKSPKPPRNTEPVTQEKKGKRRQKKALRVITKETVDEKEAQASEAAIVQEEKTYSIESNLPGNRNSNYPRFPVDTKSPVQLRRPAPQPSESSGNSSDRVRDPKS